MFGGWYAGGLTGVNYGNLKPILKEIKSKIKITINVDDTDEKILLNDIADGEWVSLVLQLLVRLIIGGKE